jgi:hypothetical protein
MEIGRRNKSWDLGLNNLLKVFVRKKEAKYNFFEILRV